ncbi:MAG: hypothetical protein K2N28_00415 [Muribaculaceae bacterium]|nr:hypothetical protein [Muribaculaceae bacterium]
MNRFGFIAVAVVVWTGAAAKITAEIIAAKATAAIFQEPILHCFIDFLYICTVKAADKPVGNLSN